MNPETKKPMPSEEYVADYFSTHRRRYLLNDSWSIKRIQDVITLIRPQAGEKVLDIGCGIGVFSIESAKRGAEVTAVDYSPEALKIARELSDCVLGPNTINFIQSAVENINFYDKGFDKAICADLVEHLSKEQFEALARNLEKALRPGGRLLLYTPNPVNLLQKPLKERPEGSKTKGFSPLRALARALLRSGEIEKLERSLGIMDLYPVIDRKLFEQKDAKYDYLHVDLKDPKYIVNYFNNNGFKVLKVRVSRTLTKLQDLPYPLNTYWGGAAAILIEKRQNG
jgi:2-polyprenyl-3-methyl-5-hydroxy-6-metoxy-1,4-benzoquinol methylase